MYSLAGKVDLQSTVNIRHAMWVLVTTQQKKQICITFSCTMDCFVGPVWCVKKEKKNIWCWNLIRLASHKRDISDARTRVSVRTIYGKQEFDKLFPPIIFTNHMIYLHIFILEALIIIFTRICGFIFYRGLCTASKQLRYVARKLFATSCLNGFSDLYD